MIRIFVAFPVRGSLADTLFVVAGNNSASENFRWTRAENLHITLFFIGEIKEEHLDSVKKTLQEIFDNAVSFSLNFDGVHFAGMKNTMLWARFEKNNFFKSLSERIYLAIKPVMNIHPVHEDPIPHITLARIKNGQNSFVNNEVGIIPDVRIDHAELWQTVQTKDGVRYQSLAKYTLAGNCK